MARVPIVVEVKNATGDAVASASVTVKARATGVNATLYNAEVAGSIIGNPTTADALGRVFVWADPDNFNLTISGTGITTYTVAYDGTVPDGAVTTPKIATGAIVTSKFTVGAVDSVAIADGTIVQGDLSYGGWQTIALASSVGTLAYRKNTAGYVYCRGDQLGGVGLLAPATLCTMPAGYRPGVATQYFGLIRTAAAGSTFPISITTAGVMTLLATLSSELLSFSQVVYFAEN